MLPILLDCLSTLKAVATIMAYLGTKRRGPCQDKPWEHNGLCLTVQFSIGALVFIITGLSRILHWKLKKKNT
jgi:hypothetical protein